MRAEAKTRGSYRWPAAALVLVALAWPVCAQTGQSSAQPTPPEQPKAAPAAPAGPEVTLDSVVAIVNGDLILQSDVDAEKRFEAFQPFSEPKPVSDQELIERLIDRTLILQQMALQPQQPIDDAALDAQIAELRKSIPKCAVYHCETEAGWKKFVADQGFTIDEFRERWKQRMQILQFIEERFRMGIRIEQADIDAYYKGTMLPVYEKEKVTPPPEAAIADRIQEILLQQRVNKLLDDWLTALRAEGTVRILTPGEEAQ